MTTLKSTNTYNGLMGDPAVQWAWARLFYVAKRGYKSEAAFQRFIIRVQDALMMHIEASPETIAERMGLERIAKKHGCLDELMRFWKVIVRHPSIGNRDNV